MWYGENPGVRGLPEMHVAVLHVRWADTLSLLLDQKWKIGGCNESAQDNGEAFTQRFPFVGRTIQTGKIARVHSSGLRSGSNVTGDFQVH